MIVGIDLGTTNSAVAYVDENGMPQIITNRDGERITPSVILFEDNVPVIGSVAKSNSVSDPLNVAQFVKRQMGNPSYKFIKEDGETFTTEELSAMILKKLKEDAESVLGETVDKAVITVPAYFSDAQRKATQDAGAIAGLKVLKVINEPTAAALAYGISKKCSNQNVIVYDLGGGTFDVTIMSINEGQVTIKATGGDKNLGGFDFDNKIIEYIANEFENQHGIDIYDDEVIVQELREKAEACKKTLSNRAKALINISACGKNLRFEITKDMFNNMIEPLINRTLLIMSTVLEESGLAWREIDKILLVGGSTRVKMVSEAIEKESGKKPSGELNPDEVVAMGAALQAYAIEHKSGGEFEDIINTKITDVNSHSLGIIACKEETGMLYNSIILEKNTPIPVEISREYVTVQDNQEIIQLRITEGEDEDLDYVNILGTTEIRLNRRPKNSPIKVIMSYDENSIVHVNVVDLIDNTYLGEMHINREANLSDDDVKEKTIKISNLNIE